MGDILKMLLKTYQTLTKNTRFMRYTVAIFLLFLFQYSFSQSLSLSDVDTIISKQNQKLGLNGDTYRFIKSKIDFASIYGSDGSDGQFRMKGETFKNAATKEILWVEIRESNPRKKLISCTMGYTAPGDVIRKMEEDLSMNGYKYSKKKKYYIKRNNRKAYVIAQVRKHSSYVSEFDSQPEMLFTAIKKLK